MSDNKNVNSKKGNAIVKPFITLVLAVILTAGIYCFLHGAFENGGIDINKVLNIIKTKTEEQITLVFVALMLAVLLFEAMFARKKLLLIASELEDYTNILKKNGKLTKSITDKGALKNAFIAYFKEKDKSGSLTPNISEYINDQVVFDLVHRGVTDQIANAMTGLGILGTFIGLTIGLNGFSLEDGGVNQDNLNVLIEGIKTAYYTSIFGVLNSLIYSQFYQRDIEKCSTALEGFLSEYNRVEKGTEISFCEEMLSYSSRQASALENFANTLAPLLEETVKEILNSTLKKYDESLDKYIKDTVKSQHDILREIVTSFMAELTKTLDARFTNLENSIDNMCKWQNGAVEKLSAVVEEFKEMSVSMSQLNSDLVNEEKIRRESEDRMLEVCKEAKYYVDSFREYSKTVNEWTEEIKDGYKQLMDKAVNKIEGIESEIKDRLIDLISEFNSKKAADEEKFTKHLEKLEMLDSSAKDAITALSALQTKNDEGMTALKGSFEKLNGEIKTVNSGNKEEIAVQFTNLQSGCDKAAERLVECLQKSQNKNDYILKVICDNSKELSADNDTIIKMLNSYIKELGYISDIKKGIEDTCGELKQLNLKNDDYLAIVKRAD